MSRKTYSKTGSLSRGQARKAVLEVKKARAGGRKTGGPKKVSSSYVERYLGHFGSGLNSHHAATKRGAAKKTSSKKTSSAARKYRRAS